MSNLGSISRAVEECGGDFVISDDPKTLASVSKVILPGVGAFGDGMRNLKRGGWIDGFQEYIVGKKLPILGICLGMQLLADEGSEGGKNQGLGLISGIVDKLKPKNKNERLPHVGWNEVYSKRPDVLLSGVPDGTDFYFVHSFHFVTSREEDVLATTPYCGGFVSVVNKENIYGTQFHPEKSSRMGFQILKNFLNK